MTGGEPTLRQLRYLVALAEHGSFTRGAAALGVSQPSFSQAIQQLEGLLGQRVAERGARAVLTPFGREAATAARLVLAEAEAFMGLARSGPGGIAGTVRLGVSPTLGPYLLPGLFARLHSTNPDLRIHVREGLPVDVLQMLNEGENDVVLLQLPVTGARLHVERLFRDPLMVAMAPEDPLASRDAITAADLEGRGLLTLGPQYRMSDQVRALADAGGGYVLRDYEGNSLDAVRQMAALGMGLAVLPALYVNQEVRGGDIVVRPFAGGRHYREIGLVWREGAGRAPLFLQLAELLKGVAA